MNSAFHEFIKYNPVWLKIKVNWAGTTLDGKYRVAYTSIENTCAIEIEFEIGIEIGLGEQR